MTSLLVSRPVNGRPMLLHTGATRPHPIADAAGVLVVVIGLAYLLPGRLIVTDMANIGRPAMLAAMAVALWWLVTRLHPALAVGGLQPVRWALAIYLATLLLGYAAGQFRGLSVLEQNGSDRTMLAALGFAGVALIAADGITTRARLERVLRAVAWVAAVMAAVGVVQFVLQRDFTEFISLPPLLTFQLPPVGFSPRGSGGLFRVAGTAGHFIEYSVLLAMALPLAIHFARFSATRGQRQCYAAITGLLVLASPLSLSRTGILALLVVLFAMAPAWNWRTRLNAAFFAVTMTMTLNVVRPGLIGTLRSLLINTEHDPSIIGRTEDYAAVSPLIAERPWLGRGVGTFLPELYRLLDNQWLLTLVTGGFVGVAGLAIVYLTGLGLGVATYRRARHRAAAGSPDPRAAEADKHLAAAIVAGILVSALSAYTFDALYFSTYALTTALFIGVAGALWRLLRSAEAR